MNRNDDEVPFDRVLDPDLDPRLDTEEEIERALGAAGRRPDVPADDYAQIRAAARGAWTATVAERQRSRFRRFTTPRLLALAASLLVIAALAIWWRARNVPPTSTQEERSIEVLAQLERALGTTTSNGRALAVGSPVHRGEEIAVGGGMLLQGSPYAVVRLANGIEIRVDRGSRLAFASVHELTLVQGAIYIDTGGTAGRAASIAVTTDLGTVRDVGTRFEVRRGEDLRVRVRDGAIALTRSTLTSPIAAQAGEEIALDHAGQVARKAVATDDPAWDWVVAAAAPFDIEGTRLDAFLRWIEREAGWRIKADAELAASFDEIELHGSVDGLSPKQAVELVLAGSGLNAEIQNGVLHIRRP